MIPLGVPNCGDGVQMPSVGVVIVGEFIVTFLQSDTRKASV